MLGRECLIRPSKLRLATAPSHGPFAFRPQLRLATRFVSQPRATVPPPMQPLGAVKASSGCTTMGRAGQHVAHRRPVRAIHNRARCFCSPPTASVFGEEGGNTSSRVEERGVPHSRGGEGEQLCFSRGYGFPSSSLTDLSPHPSVSPPCRPSRCQTPRTAVAIRGTSSSSSLHTPCPPW